MSAELFSSDTLLGLDEGHCPYLHPPRREFVSQEESVCFECGRSQLQSLVAPGRVVKDPYLESQFR